MEETKQVLSKIVFDKFRQCIEIRTGIYIDDSKKNSFKINMDTRMRILGIKDYDVYYSFIITNSLGKKEFDELLNLVLIKETFFFRDDRQLKVLTKNILPELIKRKKEKEIKIWSAGCATGEEPYSIAMAIMESHLSNSNVSIYATDISDQFLQRAKEGIYSKGSMRAIDRTILNKYFTQKDGLYYLNDQVKHQILFDSLNLIDSCYPIERNNFDVIFCKNVIIYFRLETVKAVIRRFYDMLTEGGYLFIGHSESLWQISDDFQLDEISGVFLYRKDGRNAVTPAKKRLPQKEKTVEVADFADQEVPHALKRKGDRHSTLTDRAVSGKTLTQHKHSRPVRKKDLPGWAKKGAIPAEGNYESVLEKIEEVLQTDPNNIDAHLLAGTIYANLGLYDKALKKGMDVLEIDDLSVDAYLLTGSVYYKTGEKEKAISAFKRAIYLDADSVVSRYYLGNLYKEANYIEQAIKEYKNVIRIFETKPESEEWLIGEVFTAKQLKEICERNIGVLTSNRQKEDIGLPSLPSQKV